MPPRKKKLTNADYCRRHREKIKQKETAEEREVRLAADRKRKKMSKQRNVTQHAASLQTLNSQIPSVEEEERSVEKDQYEINIGLAVAKKRLVVIDGGNVAFEHGNVDENGRKIHSVRGIQIALDHVKNYLGCACIAVVPEMRTRKGHSTNPDLLRELKAAQKLYFSSSKNLPNNNSSSDDAKFILDIAARFNGSVLSRDNYKQYLGKDPKWDEIINKRVLTYTIVGDEIFVSGDPYGIQGENLEQILTK